MPDPFKVTAEMIFSYIRNRREPETGFSVTPTIRFTKAFREANPMSLKEAYIISKTILNAIDTATDGAVDIATESLKETQGFLERKIEELHRKLELVEDHNESLIVSLEIIRKLVVKEPVLVQMIGDTHIGDSDLSKKVREVTKVFSNKQSEYISKVGDGVFPLFNVKMEENKKEQESAEPKTRFGNITTTIREMIESLREVAADAVGLSGDDKSEELHNYIDELSTITSKIERW